MRRVFPWLLPLALIGCARHHEPAQLTSAEARPSDDQVAVRIDQRLGQEPHLSIATRDVSVSVDHGVANLRGKVSSELDREAVRVIAEGTSGVTGVSDQLVVTAKGPIDAESDGVITEAALRALRTDPSLRGLVDGLELSCKDGIVMIRRDRLTDVQDKAVTKLLEGLPGVIVVTDKGVVPR
jgi:hypothetical protein